MEFPSQDDLAAITKRLNEYASGDAVAGAEALGKIYGDLKRMAASQLRKERAGHTLQPTALVHEAYLRIAEYEGARWNSRSHFFAVAAQIMRRILVDHARAKQSEKRGGGATKVELDDLSAGAGNQRWEVIDLEQALERLNEMNERQAQIVEMRFYGGMAETEIAEVLGVSTRTIKRDWIVARAWLYGQLQGG